MVDNAETWKYAGLPGNARLKLLVDFGVVLDDPFYRVGVRFNTALTHLPGSFWVLAELAAPPTMVRVEGSSKAGIPIRHPRWRYEQRVRTFAGVAVAGQVNLRADHWLGRWFVAEWQSGGGFNPTIRAVSPPWRQEEVPEGHAVDYPQ